MSTLNADSDNRRRAEAVNANGILHPVGGMTAFQAARCMLGIVNIMAEVYGAEGMRSACSALAQHQAAWDTRFRELPRDGNAQVLEPARFLAHASRGILMAAGAENLRAAVAFWAVERDAAVCQRVAAGVSPT